MGQPVSPTDLEELRRLMHLDWGELASGDRPALQNLDRAALLYGRARDPYHARALGDLDAEHLLLIGIYNTLEQADWKLYYKFVNRLCALQLARERTQARQASQRQSITGNVDPAPPATQTRVVPPACPTRAQMDAMPLDDVIALCAEGAGMTETDFRHSLNGRPPFT